MGFHISGQNEIFFAISQLQTIRNEFHFDLRDRYEFIRYEFISGSLKL